CILGLHPICGGGHRWLARIAFDYAARRIGIEHEQVPHSSSPNTVFSGNGTFNGRSAINSSGTAPFAVSRSSEYSFHVLQPAFLDKITSPVCSSRRTNTSSPSNRNSAGNLTAWLPPLLKSRAVLVGIRTSVYTWYRLPWSYGQEIHPY